MFEPADEQARRDERAIVRDGFFYSVMVGLGETYVPAFVLAAGLGEVAAGWIATLPLLAGATFQLVAPLASWRLGSYRRWVVVCARLQALSLLPLAAGAVLGGVEAAWVFPVAAAYWGFGMATSPAWNAWVAALVGPERRARFFAHRTRWAQAALFAAIVAGGFALHATAGERPLLPFAGLFLLAAGARWLSARALASQSEPEGLARSHRVAPVGHLVSEMGRSEGGRLLLYLLAMQVALNVAAPFFTPYMLHHLELSYGSFTTLTAAAFFARILALPLLGRWAHLRGAGPVVRVGALAIVPLPALWLVSDHLGYLLALQILSGVAWATLEFGTMLSFFERLPDRDRAAILAFFNFANTCAMAVGALLGGMLLRESGGAGYALLFLLSVAGRLVSFAILPRRLEDVPVPESISMRTLAVRPGAGAIQRPITATLGEKADPALDAGGGG